MSEPQSTPFDERSRGKVDRWATIESVDELADRVVHDLIQPLNEIANNVWLCRESIGDPSVANPHDVLNSIDAQVMRAAEMIRAARRLVTDWAATHGRVVRNGPSDTV